MPHVLTNALILCPQFVGSVGVRKLVVLLIAHSVFLYFRLVIKSAILCQGVWILLVRHLHCQNEVSAMNNHPILKTDRLKSCIIVGEICNLVKVKSPSPTFIPIEVCNSNF